MKTRETADQTRSSVTGKVIKLKVKKTAEDKEVCIYKILLLNTHSRACHCTTGNANYSDLSFFLQRDINRKQLLHFLNST